MQYAGDATISVTMVEATGTQNVVIPLLVARARAFLLRRCERGGVEHGLVSPHGKENPT